jgi:hypothetical protein
MHGGLVNRTLAAISSHFFIFHSSLFFIFNFHGQTRDGQTMKIKNPPGEPGGLQLKTTIVARFDMASIGTVPD